MRQHAIWIVGGVTAVLGIAFAMPSGRGGATAYEPLAGKVWAINGTALQAVVSTSTISEVAASTEPLHPSEAVLPVPPTKRIESPKRIRQAASNRIVKIAPAPIMAAAKTEIVSSSASVVTTPAPVPSVDVPQYALEDVADRYESDESKYPLDRSVTNTGVTLSLIGLERPEKAFVLKIAVANASTADFFVKGFSITSADQYLGSHAIFRLMVEAGRTREGYVMFSRPQAGAAVHIKLQEDGGKGRALDIAIPYPF
jgi:hypothetical protein